jgi:hypothetical protein
MTDERPAPLPRLLWDDEWEAPPSNRRRFRFVAAFMGIALAVTCVALLRNRVQLWYPNDDRVWVPIASVPSAMPPDTIHRAERVTPTGRSLDDLSEPNDVPASPPPRRRPSPQMAARPNRGAGYLSINSSPWAELSVDGHVVGNTPQVRIRVTPGRHRLLLVRKGFQTHSAWVTVAAGGTVRLTDITLESVAQ